MANDLKKSALAWIPEKSWKRLQELFFVIITIITVSLISLMIVKISQTNDTLISLNGLIAAGLMSFILVFLAIIYFSIQYFIRNSYVQKLSD